MVEEVFGKRKKIMLTGGRSAKILYEKISQDINFIKLMKRSDFYLTDERCVPLYHPQSNSKMLKESLFNNSFKYIKGMKFLNFRNKKIYNFAKEYESTLPKKLDLILLSIGDDGHIASLFPRSKGLFEKRKSFVYSISPKSPKKRMTITHKVIKSAKNIIVLALGEAKKEMYMQALKNPKDFRSIPACLVLNGIWVFDLEKFNTDLCLKS